MTLFRISQICARLRLRGIGLFFVALLFSPHAIAQTITLSPTSLPPGSLGLSYNQTVTATDGDSDDITGPLDGDDTYTYAVTVGALPPGLTLNIYTGNIFGTPSSANTYNFSITATNQATTPVSGTQAYSLVIGGNTLTLNPPTLPNATQGATYNQTVTASGGSGTYTYSVSAGALPAGLSLNPNTGAITGIPTGSGPASFTIQALDPTTGNFGTQAYNINVGTNSLTLNPASLPNATKGAAYSQTVAASGGTGPYTYAVTSGTLPAGLSLNPSSGVISGAPSGTGASGFTIGAIDASGNSGSRNYTINVGTNSLTLSPSSLPAGSQGVAYNQTLSASGGSGPYTYAITSGSLPAGLSLNPSTGAITGTPTSNGPFTFTVQASDGNGDTGAQSYTMSVGTNALTVNPATLPPAMQGSLYNQTVGATGGTGPYTYSVIAGALPAGVSLNPSSGAISGVPTTAGPATFTIEAQDTAGNYGTRAYNVNVGSNVLTLNPASLPNGTQGTAYRQTVSASGGTAPYTYSVTAGTLPAGLTLAAATGVISGTPTGAGASGFTIGARDSAGNTGSRAYSVNIGTNSLILNPTSLPAATNGVAYAQTVSASGGTAPYSYTISAGALPAGLSLNASTGAITGTPTGSGIANFTVRAADGNGNVGSRAYTVSTGKNTLAINPATLPAAVQGTPYNQIVSASGGSGGPYRFAIIAGALPPGLTFNTTSGAISGTPTTIGSFGVTIQARDANGNIGSRAYAAIAVRPNPVSDPDVQGLIAAQAATARRFATTQVTNVATHLETLHDAFDPCLVNGGIGVTVYDPVSGLPVDPTAPNPANPAGKGTQVGPPKCDASNIFSFGFWGGGNVQIGSGNLNGQSNRFSSDGVTFGADGRIADNLIIGGAVGYGTDSTNIGADGTSNAAQNFDATFYASYRPFDHWFLDAVAGYGTLNFSSQRFVAFDGTTAGGARSGSDWFGSVILTSEIKQGPLTVAPYLRADIVSTSLDGYAEQGSSLALTYGAVGFNAAAGVLGVRALYDIDTAWGVIAPMARLEYRRELDGGFNQSMFYTDLGAGQAYVLNEPDMSLNLFTGALGFRARAGANLSAQFEYGVTGGANSLLVQSLRGTLRIGF